MLSLLEVQKRQRHVTQENMVYSLLQQMLREDKDKKRVETLYPTICQRVTTTEDKRLGLKEDLKIHAHGK